jgi:thiosulfate/3-mercaptopyruvate sulfurtransferase
MMKDETRSAVKDSLMDYAHPDALISTDALAKALGKDTLKILDATFFIPPDPRTPQASFEAAHLPEAVLFDVDRISDTRSPYPHMLPDEKTFSEAVSRLGISNDDEIVVYDVHGLMSAARAWWMFRVFGHSKVRILAGGLPQWQAEGRPVESGAVNPEAGEFVARLNPALIRTREAVLENITHPQEQVLDVRSAERYWGRVPEPREGLRSGHIPGSMNLPWNELVDPETHTVHSAETLRKRFEGAGLNLSKPVTCSCGSGVTACLAAFGLYLLGHEAVSVYDGSWAEWGAVPELPIAK